MLYSGYGTDSHILTLFILILVGMTDNFTWTEDLADYINVNDDLTGEGFLHVDRTKYYDFEDLSGFLSNGTLRIISLFFP